MKREYIQHGIMVLFVSVMAGIFYAAFGWIGLAVLALFQLGEISMKLSEIADHLKRP